MSEKERLGCEKFAQTIGQGPCLTLDDSQQKVWAREREREKEKQRKICFDFTLWLSARHFALNSNCFAWHSFVRSVLFFCRLLVRDLFLFSAYSLWKFSPPSLPRWFFFSGRFEHLHTHLLTNGSERKTKWFLRVCQQSKQMMMVATDVR